jgi:hypothetical protein
MLSGGAKGALLESFHPLIQPSDADSAMAARRLLLHGLFASSGFYKVSVLGSSWFSITLSRPMGGMNSRLKLARVLTTSASSAQESQPEIP